MTYPQMDPRRLDLTGSFGLRVAGRDAAEVRIGTAGRWGQRVNLATNPSFEATTGSYVTVRTNLATSPRSYTPAASGPHPGLGAGPYTGSAEIDGVRQAIDPLALVGGTTYVRLLIESGAVPLGEYFDGDESPDPDLTPAWTGVAGASTSVLRGAGVAWRGGTGQAALVSSHQWAESGGRSLRLIPTGGTDSFGDWRFYDANALPAGTYRVSAMCHITAPQGNQGPNARRIVVNRSTGASWVSTSSAQAPNAPGDTRLSVTATLHGLNAYVRLYNGASAGNGDVWYDALLVEDVTDLAAQWSALPDPKPTLADWLDERLGGDYFDGDTPNTPAALHHWTATPHASTSVQTLAWTPGD